MTERWAKYADRPNLRRALMVADARARLPPRSPGVHMPRPPPAPSARDDDVARRDRLRDRARDAEGERSEMDAERRRML